MGNKHLHEVTPSRCQSVTTKGRFALTRRYFRLGLGRGRSVLRSTVRFAIV